MSAITTVKGELIFRIFDEANKALLAEGPNGKQTAREGAELFLLWKKSNFGIVATSNERSFFFAAEFNILCKSGEYEKGCISRIHIKPIIDYFGQEVTWKKTFS